ncbi:hypothetical protein [Sediminicoccus sp. KRV36]|uniref:hypothetical protein n=1 Tax=Sediminicoccus sp. KRV36 TaxID=3133721 RepID=UPI00200E89A7|nr:hypothetical protein [Sediminicoccus rosea]UPY37430.1 hypothetical protein LHU95_01705 [Sediminicoccus rosea]
MQRLSILATAVLLLATPALAQPDKGNTREDGITEQHREMRRQGEASVPHQNRESRRGDATALETETSREWLKEAQDALRAGQFGQANEYLERAATRLLSRSTEPSVAAEPMRDARLAHISEARAALYRRDRREASRQIEMAIVAR